MICNKTNPVWNIYSIDILFMDSSENKKQTLFVNSTKIAYIEIWPEKPGSGFGNPLGQAY
jgi:hypothetical protein